MTLFLFASPILDKEELLSPVLQLTSTLTYLFGGRLVGSLPLICRTRALGSRERLDRCFEEVLSGFFRLFSFSPTRGATGRSSRDLILDIRAAFFRAAVPDAT